MRRKKRARNLRKNAAVFVRNRRREEKNKRFADLHLWTPSIVNKRLPTEADWILQGVSVREGLRSPEIRGRVENWKTNYLKAIDEVRTTQSELFDAETEDNLDALYWKISKLSLQDFLNVMIAEPNRLSIESVYISSDQVKMINKLIARWDNIM